MADRSNTFIYAQEIVRLYDAHDKEIGMTVGGKKEAAYAMSQSQRIAKAVIYSDLYGTETIDRLPESTLSKYKDKKHLGDNLLFWLGAPLVINK